MGLEIRKTKRITLKGTWKVEFSEIRPTSAHRVQGYVDAPYIPMFITEVQTPRDPDEKVTEFGTYKRSDAAGACHSCIYFPDRERVARRPPVCDHCIAELPVDAYYVKKS